MHFTLARFLAESSERQLSYLALMKPDHPTTGTDKADLSVMLRHLPTCKNIAIAVTTTKPMNETAGNKGRTLPPKAVRSAACFPSRDTHIKERSAHCALHLPEAHTEKPERLAVATTFGFEPMEGGTGVLGGARSPHWSPTLAEK
ncbi:MAG: hypothetical protein H9535_03595 [Ignavibacteria bacterium]|nr:hypothetical protein [Ignavibacteria bacterium]